MKFHYNDGGRAEAGFKGSADDCAVRAIAIASGRPYKEIYELANAHASKPKEGARTGLTKTTVHTLMKHYGFEWVPTMKIGSGTQVHLRESDLPEGTIIARVSKHIVAIIDKVIHDTHDPSRNGTRCVYGYWRKP